MVLGSIGYPTDGGADAKVEVPWVEEEVQFFTGSFRENVHAFLDRFAVRDANECERGVHGHTIILRSEESGLVCELRVMVEVVERSKRIHCDQCKCIGWSHHPVTAVKYHFMIPAPPATAPLEGQIGRGRKMCTYCNRSIPAGARTCPYCSGDLNRNPGVTELHTHLMHGVIHSNGFG
eukprot:CAMPEP_0118944840 /NCGR_PEP_ID=MMETSP1169-20130426/41113_1 /TAXON_ID=36882 /ORGANISM="Pyramimonas obovata, Strain CCMP722" /LENGTH=177 /DNA_ID=CAMNT_0006890413 /DNA_START=186 /DNA_END=716 /DNA_ORIENTATION=+